MEIEKNERQKGIIRYNCADSLDRTNIATFFVSFQLVAEMARRLGVINDSDYNTPANPGGGTVLPPFTSGINNNTSSGNLSTLLTSVYNSTVNTPSNPTSGDSTSQTEDGNNPNKASNSNTTIENSNTNKQTQQQQQQQQAWSAVDKSIDKITNGLRRTGLIECLAEFFVLNGDVCSVLYTNSPAMHSALMRDFSPTISSAPINAVIAIQRRYQNLYLDGARQAQYEMLLGLNISTHFPFLSNTNGPYSFFSLPSPFSAHLNIISSSKLKPPPSPVNIKKKEERNSNSNEDTISSKKLQAEQLKLKYISSQELVSSFPSFILKPIPSVLKLQQIITNSNSPENNTYSEILLQDADGFCWICPNEYDIVEMYIYLQEPCYVTELGLTISHGVNEDTYPHTIDLFMGTYLDKMHVAFQGLYIPRCASGTKLYYNIPANMWRAYEGSGIYDFDLGSGTFDFHSFF